MAEQPRFVVVGQYEVVRMNRTDGEGQTLGFKRLSGRGPDVPPEGALQFNPELMPEGTRVAILYPVVARQAQPAPGRPEPEAATSRPESESAPAQGVEESPASGGE